MVLSTPIMRITAWPKFVSARRAASLNVPFHWPITGSGGARPVSKETQETEKTRLGSDWSDLMRRAVMASVPIVGRLELPFISRVLILERLSRTTHVQQVRGMSPAPIVDLDHNSAQRTSALHMPIKPFMIVA